MKKKTVKRLGALALAVWMSVGCAASALAVSPACDEAYYATLDYYGTLTEASVVKSYRLYGAESITDYGVYEAVENLTDATVPSVTDGRVSFDLSGTDTDRFYFEGKTTQPYEDLPWTLSISYRLNGVPVEAEKLAGEKGMVEIFLDVVPNLAAPEYNRTNLVLTAATAFNADDILSLEAEGAQIQLVGNLRAVMFMILPGEEQHFVIRVGSEDFSFAGMMFLAVPATLKQLEQIADVKQAKEEAQDSLDAIDESLDIVLETLEGMSGSLRATAKGLDQLNAVRGSVSAGKDGVYDKTDLALSDLDALAEKMGTLDPYIDTASQAITETNAALNDLNAAVLNLKPELAAVRESVEAIQEDTAAMAELLKDVESYNGRATNLAKSLSGHLDDMEDETEDLQLRLKILEGRLKSVSGVSAVKTSDLLGMLPADEAAQLMKVLELHSDYEDYLADNGMTAAQLSFEDYIVAGAYQQYCPVYVEQYVKKVVEGYAAAQMAAGNTPTEEELAAVKEQAMADAQASLPSMTDFARNTPQGQAAARQAQSANEAYEEFSGRMTMVDTINKKIREINTLITDITGPTGELMGTLADLCESLGDVGLVDDMAALSHLCEDLLKTMESHEGEGESLLGHLDELGDLAVRVTRVADELLDRVDGLNGLLNKYEPDVQSALGDIQTLSGSLQSTLHDTRSALSAAEELLRSNGPALNAGTNQTLSGLSEALRKSTAGLDQTGTIRSAKDTVTGLIDDKWEEHSGQVDGLLNIDAGAPAVSMTDPRNGAPASIQYIMRTQEIKVEEESAGTAAGAQEESTTFWGRVADMFKGLWESFKRLLHIG